MKKTGLLLSIAGMAAVGVAVGGAVGMIGWSSEAWAACVPIADCASLGYKYSSADCPNGGIKCPFDTSKYFCAEPCTYTVTKSSCDSQCKNVGDQACTKNGTVYYKACGSSKCSSGQTCENGTCKSNVASSGWCCDDTGSYCSGYSYCRSNTGCPDCSDMMSSCRASGGTPAFQYCNTNVAVHPYYPAAKFDCQ